MSRFTAPVAGWLLVALLVASSARSGEPEPFESPDPRGARAVPEEPRRRSADERAEDLSTATALAAVQDDIDVQHYLLVLEFIPGNPRVTGSVTVTATSLVTGLPAPRAGPDAPT